MYCQVEELPTTAMAGGSVPGTAFAHHVAWDTVQQSRVTVPAGPYVAWFDESSGMKTVVPTLRQSEECTTEPGLAARNLGMASTHHSARHSLRHLESKAAELRIDLLAHTRSRTELMGFAVLEMGQFQFEVVFEDVHGTAWFENHKNQLYVYRVLHVLPNTANRVAQPCT